MHEHTSQALTPANVQASLQLLLTKDAGHFARAEAAGELKSGNPNQIATDVCITLRYLTGGLLTSGVAGVERSTSSAPDPNRLQIVNFAFGELGSAAIQSKSDVAKMKAADIKLLAEYLQQHLDHDPQDACTSATQSQLAPKSVRTLTDLG
ncbi:hypothetical protein WJX77_001357 [Trebouxia sp. C0004]